MSTDPDHRFELSIGLDKLEIALAMATELDSEQKWKQLGDKALAKGSFTIAEECFDRAGDLNTLLLIFTFAISLESLDHISHVIRLGRLAAPTSSGPWARRHRNWVATTSPSPASSAL